tara:strand:- start:222 stop:506 length:285 start_codon:yes stop_codon:yes gene_type:complete
MGNISNIILVKIFGPEKLEDLKYPKANRNPILVKSLRSVSVFSVREFGKLKKRLLSPLLKTGGLLNIACSLLFKIFILGMTESNLILFLIGTTL